MKLYTKVREIPGCDQIQVGTKEDWVQFFDSMNIQFDYMLDRGFIKSEQLDINEVVLDLDKRVTYIERYLKTNEV